LILKLVKKCELYRQNHGAAQHQRLNQKPNNNKQNNYNLEKKKTNLKHNAKLASK